MRAIDTVQHLSPCADAVSWLGDRDLATAWAECPRGDWMLWLYHRSANYDKRLTVLVGGLIANEVRHLMADDRSTAAIDTCLAYGRGKASDDQLAAARDAARAAAEVTSDAARTTARTAAWAATMAATRAAWATAWAAAADAALDTGASTRGATMQRYADLCREYLPVPVINPPQGEAGEEG